MESNKLYQMLRARSSSGDNFFHEVCRARSLSLLWRAEGVIDEPIPSILTTRNYKGEQCIHIIVKVNDIYALEMMQIVLHLGADINGQETLGGFTPLHLCVLEKNYELAEWLCNAPGINLEATTYGGQTACQMAFEYNDQKMMEVMKKAGANCEPPTVNKSCDS